ncbi:C-type mannose receptor 2-like [Astyanax mexicanus]|uniref:C-type mannose receptor 2-like n=1 Tax=Astyanax mexicanus TaxID=7994 RepID=UPI0020CB0973|nr:C-type mannose receptor 2-like [Astyanax mexicanus]
MDPNCISVMFLLSAVCGVSPYVPHRYHFVNQNKTWTEAQSYCRKTYTDLATINNMDEMKKLNDTLKNLRKLAIYPHIGLKRRGTGRWQWSLADESFYGSGCMLGTSSAALVSSPGKDCVAMNKSDGSCITYDCMTTFSSFVCYVDKIGPGNYIFINDSKTWREAQSYCRQSYTDLASVRNLTENKQICEVAENSSGSFWIGLFYDIWEWSDQSNSSFRYWNSTQANNNQQVAGGGENCTGVSLKQSGLWHDINCDVQFPFICHEDKLILIQQKLSWREALRYCRENHVDLVSVHSEEIQLWVKDVAQKASTNHVWLGLRHTCALSLWFWISGDFICYDNWAPGNGAEGEDCSPVERTGAVQARGDQQWVSLPENQTLNFICIRYED